MSSRPLIIATLIGATVGVPYLASRSSTGPKGASPFNVPPSTNYVPPQSGVATRLPMVPPTSPAVPQLQPGRASSTTLPIAGAQFTSIDQVLRFDVTKEWVYQNWSRKSTGPTDVGLFSVRVPLVMAPRLNGLAGSLTYYFNSDGQVEHISFRGRTGDSTQLVELLTRSYGFERSAAPTGEQLYQVFYRRQVQSELRTHPEAILWSNSPNQSIAVELELARPGSKRVLPPRPTGFEVPQVAATPAPTAGPPPAATAADPAGSTADSKSGSYFNRIRHATPQEESQVLWKRWPN
jgi:hypothetical protein